MSVDVKYRATASATGGRDGRAKTEDGSLDVKLTAYQTLCGSSIDTRRGTTAIRPRWLRRERSLRYLDL